MWNRRYFGVRYFASRYWAKTGAQPNLLDVLVATAVSLSNIKTATPIQ